MDRWIALFGAVTLAASLTACDEEAPTTARIQPMAADAAADAQANDRHEIEVPQVVTLRFEPATPLAGRGAMALAELPTGSRNVRLAYAFSVGGRTLQAEKDRVDLRSARPGERLQVTVTPWLGETPGAPTSHAVRLRAPAPRVMGVSFEPARGLTAGSRVEARPLVEDGNPRTTTHRFQWLVNGDRQSAYERSFSTEGLQRGGEIRVEVIARDGSESSDAYMSEAIVLENAAPALVHGPLDFDDAGGLDAHLSGQDPDGDMPVRFSLVQGPGGLSLSRDGHLTWPDAAETPGRHAVEIELRDALGATSKTRFSVDIGTPAAPAP